MYLSSLFQADVSPGMRVGAAVGYKPALPRKMAIGKQSHGRALAAARRRPSWTTTCAGGLLPRHIRRASAATTRLSWTPCWRASGICPAGTRAHRAPRAACSCGPRCRRGMDAQALLAWLRGKQRGLRARHASSTSKGGHENTHAPELLQRHRRGRSGKGMRALGAALANNRRI